jgi:hypothetical protein
MKLNFPEGVSLHYDSDGTAYRAHDCAGVLDIGDRNPAPFFAAGFTESIEAADEAVQEAVAADVAVETESDAEQADAGDAPADAQ